MEGVTVQRIDNIRDAIRSVHRDHRTVDRIWHGSVESPVPVGDPEGSGCGLIQASLVGWVRCCNLLGIVPEYLLFSINQGNEALGKGLKLYLEECHIGSMPCREQDRAVCAISGLKRSLNTIPRNIRATMNAFIFSQQLYARKY